MATPTSNNETAPNGGYFRGEHGLWTYQRYAPDATVTLETIGLTAPVAAFYRRTNL